MLGQNARTKWLDNQVYVGSVSHNSKLKYLFKLWETLHKKLSVHFVQEFYVINVA